jgi:small subunit ribosomal protein S6
VKYEGLFILDTAGKEEDVQALIDRVKHVIESAGGKVLSVQKMDKRPFARASGNRRSGFYVNVIFDAPTAAIQTLRAKFTLDDDVFRVQFTRADETPAPKTAEAARG